MCARGAKTQVDVLAIKCVSFVTYPHESGLLWSPSRQQNIIALILKCSILLCLELVYSILDYVAPRYQRMSFLCRHLASDIFHVRKKKRLLRKSDFFRKYLEGKQNNQIKIIFD